MQIISKKFSNRMRYCLMIMSDTMIFDFFKFLNYVKWKICWKNINFLISWLCKFRFRYGYLNHIFNLFLPFNPLLPPFTWFYWVQHLFLLDTFMTYRVTVLIVFISYVCFKTYSYVCFDVRFRIAPITEVGKIISGHWALCAWVIERCLRLWHSLNSFPYQRLAWH